MDRPDIPVAFDPWTATAAQALRAMDAHPDAFDQYQAAQEVNAARESCRAPGGGGVVLECLARCFGVGLMPPRWLRDQLIQRRRFVVDGGSLTWDAPEAFGRHFPPNTHLATVKRDVRLKAKVYTEVGLLLDEHPNLAINRDLFERIAERLFDREKLWISGVYVERLYYRALREGSLSHAQLRKAQRQDQSQILDKV